MSARRYFIYVMTSSSLSAMYIGVKNDVGRRVVEPRNGEGSEFVKKYRVTRLVYVEEYENPTDAIARESSSRVGNGFERMN